MSLPVVERPSVCRNAVRIQRGLRRPGEAVDRGGPHPVCLPTALSQPHAPEPGKP